MNMIIAGHDCKKCIHYKETEESNFKITCLAKNKKYFYGQRIPCEEREINNELKDKKTD